MTNQQIYDYIEKHVESHKNQKGQPYVADEYVKSGYGQTEGGYFEEAKKYPEVKNDPDLAEPSQKWHLIHAYYDYKVREKNFNLDSKSSLASLKCPQLLLWIAEVARLEKERLEQAKKVAIGNEVKSGSKKCLNIADEKFKDALKWNEINAIIRDEKTWDKVMLRVEQIK